MMKHLNCNIQLARAKEAERNYVEAAAAYEAADVLSVFQSLNQKKESVN